MTTSEFKLEFRTYYNNITSNQAPGVNDYEISQFLTLAEEQIVTEIYEGRYDGFEKSESNRRYLDALLVRWSLNPNINTSTNKFDAYTKEYNGTLEKQDDPTRVLFIVMEWAVIRKNNKSKTVDVIPIKYDDFLRTYKNPFRGVSSKRVLRLDDGNDKVQLHCDKDWSIDSYNVEFIKKPKPIIIGNDDFAGLTINGCPVETSVECELDESLHRSILLRAVQLAKAAWQSK